jgi:GMP synthase-like glutamine amidotransferase
MMRIHVLQHVPFEGPAGVESWARARGHELRTVHLYAGEPPPEPDAYDWLVVLGGPMNVDEEDRHAFLAPEKRAIARAIRAEKLVLGICLGSQLVASALGARVVRADREEIGWFSVELTDEALSHRIFARVPRRFTTFHWHGDTFEIPRGAVCAASSDLCANQAFVYGDRVVGVQFHPEVTKESLTPMVEHEDGSGLALGQPRFDENSAVLASLLDGLRHSAE